MLSEMRAVHDANGRMLANWLHQSRFRDVSRDPPRRSGARSTIWLQFMQERLNREEHVASALMSIKPWQPERSSLVRRTQVARPVMSSTASQCSSPVSVTKAVHVAKGARLTMLLQRPRVNSVSKVHAAMGHRSVHAQLYMSSRDNKAHFASGMTSATGPST